MTFRGIRPGRWAVRSLGREEPSSWVEREPAWNGYDGLDPAEYPRYVVLAPCCAYAAGYCCGVSHTGRFCHAGPDIQGSSPEGFRDVLTYEQVRALILEDNADLWQAECGVGLMIDDAATAEYEWGWMIEFAPDDWSRVPEDHWLRRSFRLAAVDRETGRLQRVGSSGVNAAIIRLLEARPPELRAGLVEIRGTTGVAQVRVSDRAFALVRPRRERETEPGAAAAGGE
jgi:hypothetical protein